MTEDIVERLRAAEIWLRHTRDGAVPDGAPYEAATEITRLREEAAAWEHDNDVLGKLLSKLTKEKEALREEVARLLEALKPFAELAKLIPEKDIHAGCVVDAFYLRAARAAIREGGENECCCRPKLKTSAGRVYRHDCSPL